ncbi:MAG: rhodanese-like domain-containing protein [Planctomycetes bacterium]|nr:rhodanese-like domain-containing protein [Planctomycetota bacterium]
MNRLKLAAILIVPLLAGCAPRAANVTEIKNAQDMKTKMDAGNIRVIHALDAEHYAKGHIPGAENIDYEKMKPEMLPAQKDQPLIFYCTGGMCPVGRMAANKAASWGYTHVSVYEGGLKNWQSSGMTVATGAK